MHTQHKRILNGVIDAYIEAIYFTDTGEEEQPPKDMPLSPSAYLLCAAECAMFLVECDRLGLLSDYIDAGRTVDSFGHDFWLTRQGHGAGFWDRGLGELGDKLTEQAKLAGEVYTYVGDDNTICLNN
jgi:hypothetical protein